MKIKKDDIALIISGKDKGRKGKVGAIYQKDKKVIIDGLNIIKKNIKPKKEGEKGKTVEVPRPINISKIKLICPFCKKPTKVSYRIKEDNKKKRKTRICKKCNAEII